MEYDSVAGELALLPRMFTEADLDSVVEERSGVLEVRALVFPVLLLHDAQGRAFFFLVLLLHGPKARQSGIVATPAWHSAGGALVDVSDLCVSKATTALGTSPVPAPLLPGLLTLQMTMVQAPTQSITVLVVLPRRATMYVPDDLNYSLSIIKHSGCNKSLSHADRLRATVPARAQQLLQVCGRRNRGGICGAGSPGAETFPSSLQETHDTTLHPLPVLQAVCCRALPMVSH